MTELRELSERAIACAADVRDEDVGDVTLTGVLRPCRAEGRAMRPEQVELVAGCAADTPAGRNGDLEEVVGPVAFLLSDAASCVTGVDLLVDGGHTIW